MAYTLVMTPEVQAWLHDLRKRDRGQRDPGRPQGGELVSDDFYDSRGWLAKVNTNEWDNASPGSTLLNIPDSQQHNQTVTQYDGLGRPVIVTSYDNTVPAPGSTVQSVTYTQYTGDMVTTVATGAIPAAVLPNATATVTDALGRATELDSYTAAPAITTGTDPGGFATVAISGGTSQATSYGYDTRGWPSAITDATTGETWTRSYDQLGNVTSSSDPNAPAPPR